MPPRKPVPPPAIVNWVSAIPLAVWQSLIAAVVTIILAWIGNNAALKVAEVKTTLEATTATTDHKLTQIKTMVDGAMTEQLRIVAELRRQWAERPDHKPEDVAAADAADVALKAHEATLKQAEIKQP